VRSLGTGRAFGAYAYAPPRYPNYADSVEILRKQISPAISSRARVRGRTDDSIRPPLLNHCCAKDALNYSLGSCSTESAPSSPYRSSGYYPPQNGYSGSKSYPLPETMQQSAAPPAQQTWYFCDNPRGLLPRRSVTQQPASGAGNTRPDRSTAAIALAHGGSSIVGRIPPSQRGTGASGFVMPTNGSAHRVRLARS
jgi:hypothetical protein